MKRLYIIGNGFDLYHRIPSRYADFHQYITAYEPELLEQLEAYFDFQVDGNYLWCNFEQDLCRFDHQGFMGTYDHIDVSAESFKLSEFYGLEDEVTAESDNLVESIQEAFRNWIESFDLEEIYQSGFSPIALDPDALYINFNYTDTLELFYDIPKSNILYIHNNANAYDGELIFGHGQAEDGAELPTFDEEGEPTRTPYTDSENASRAPFYAFKKDTEEVLQKHQGWFSKLKDLEEVIILGHSIGEVDWPYFREVAKRLHQSPWKISYYGEWEFEELQKRIKAINNQINVQMIRLNELS